MSDRNRNKNQRGGCGSKKSERGAGREDFDQKLNFKKKDFDDKKIKSSRSDLAVTISKR